MSQAQNLTKYHNEVRRISQQLNCSYAAARAIHREAKADGRSIASVIRERETRPGAPLKLAAKPSPEQSTAVIVREASIESLNAAAALLRVCQNDLARAQAAVALVARLRE
jgi:hypothetical protein